MIQNPQSVLFCCDHNAVRSPMARGDHEQNYGTRIYVQSAGVKSDLEIDGFAIAVCAEIESGSTGTACGASATWRNGATGSAPTTSSSPSRPRRERAGARIHRWHAIDVEYWPTFDPTGLGETREAKLRAFRQTRDQIATRIRARFGPPDPPRPAEG